MTVTPALSLIVPAHNEARAIAANLSAITATLEALERPFEVLVVCDGSTDGTAEAAAALGDPRIRVLRHHQNLGKGYALCAGIAEAHGRLIGWLDADLDIHPSVIVEAAEVLDGEGMDAAIGSKRHARSRVRYPAQRRFLSSGFQLLVRALFRINVRDTQVGAKVFRREMLDVVAPLLLIKRYAFDLEVLAVGAEFGFDRIQEVPVQIDYRFTGTGINSSAVQRMFLDTLAIAYRIHLRHWYVRQFAAHQRQRGDAAAAAERMPARNPPSRITA